MGGSSAGPWTEAAPAPCPQQKLRAQAEAQQPVFDALRDELRGAQEVGERLQQRHGERDVEAGRWRERAAQLLERWQAVLAQADMRQRELDQLGRQLRYYRESADPLDAWLRGAKQRQEQIQAVPLANSRAVREQLRQEKVGLGRRGCGGGVSGARVRADSRIPQALLEEIERHGEKVEECQKFAKQYINAIKVSSLAPASPAREGVLGPEPPGVAPSPGLAGGVGGSANRWLTWISHRTMSSSWSHTRHSLSRWPLRPRNPRSSQGPRASSRR